MDKAVILGDGLLGSEIHRQTQWHVLSRKKDGFDITDITTYDILREYTNENKNITFINCIANTDTYSQNRQLHWDVNYKGVASLVEFCNKYQIKLVHISTDYVYANSSACPDENSIPVHQETYYAYTKLLADAYIELKSKNYLILRATHKQYPFQHSHAWIDQIGNFDYVDVIASKIIDITKKGVCGIYNVGTELKSMYNLAIKTNKNVKPKLSPKKVPKNTQMNLDKFKSI